MQKIHKGIVAIAVVIVVTGFVFYQYAAKIFQTAKNDALTPTVQKPEPKKSVKTYPMEPGVVKEVSATVVYDVPEAEITHNVRYTVALDKEGKVVSVKMVELPKEEASDKQKEFATNLTGMIKGKNFSEITKVDKVGKSTLTTDAFNSVVDDLQSQL